MKMDKKTKEFVVYTLTDILKLAESFEADDNTPFILDMTLQFKTEHLEDTVCAAEIKFSSDFELNKKQDIVIKVECDEPDLFLTQVHDHLMRFKK